MLRKNEYFHSQTMPALAPNPPTKTWLSKKKVWGKFPPNTHSVTQPVPLPGHILGNNRLRKTEEKRQPNGRKRSRSNFLKFVFLFKPGFTDSAALHDPTQATPVCANDLHLLWHQKLINSLQRGWGRFSDAFHHFSKHFSTIHLCFGVVLSPGICSSLDFC